MARTDRRLTQSGTITRRLVECPETFLWQSDDNDLALSDHLKTGQRRSGQNRPTREAGTELFYSAECFGGKLVFVRQLRGPHLSTCP